MKTPEELADEYIEKKWGWLKKSQAKGEWNTQSTYSYRDAFLAGYAAANRWISVEEELPEVEQECLTLDSDTAYLDRRVSLNFFYDKECWDHMLITHWQPLPPLPTK